jgi:hypothetical protein
MQGAPAVNRIWSANDSGRMDYPIRPEVFSAFYSIVIGTTNDRVTVHEVAPPEQRSGVPVEVYVAITVTDCWPAGIGVKYAVLLLAEQPLIPALMPQSTIRASSAWLSRLRRRKQNASMPSGRNASTVLPAAVRSSEVFVPSGRFAGVETERIAVDAVVPEIVMLGGNMEQLT